MSQDNEGNSGVRHTSAFNNTGVFIPVILIVEISSIRIYSWYWMTAGM